MHPFPGQKDHPGGCSTHRGELEGLWLCSKGWKSRGVGAAGGGEHSWDRCRDVKNRAGEEGKPGCKQPRVGAGTGQGGVLQLACSSASTLLLRSSISSFISLEGPEKVTEGMAVSKIPLLR